MQSNPDLIRRLRGFLRKDQILDSDLWREIYARDASYFNIPPLVIVRPESVGEVQQLLAAAAAAGTGVTFRSGGTSLSGQAVNSGIICELRTAWKKYRVSDGGRRVWFEPGLTAAQVNQRLAPYHVHIGPDPASSSAAMMGGILANNSSGMSAGVEHNSYHTLASIEFLLPDGSRYNSASSDDRTRFERDRSDLCRGLMEIRREIIADPDTLERITRKYRIKNVTGYAMNAFVDFDNPMDIFAHLLIGSEGTLGYIVAGELNTLPLYSVYTSALLYFPTVVQAAASAAFLGQTGALAVELMDYASLRTAAGMENDKAPGTTAILIDYGASSSEEMQAIIADIEPKIRKIAGLESMEPFTTTVEARARLWRIRDGVFPCVAGARMPGSTVILEDVAAPVENLDALVEGIQKLFKANDYDGAIFGHARDGNMHPLITTPITSQDDIRRFRDYMDGLVEHVISLDGSLKGEHGTGRAVAPFVAREWGDKIYGYMKRLKTLVDPKGLMNPGVMINDDPECYLKPLKPMPVFGEKMGYAHADKCMECGYCENVCPSRYVTLTPRQRLQARRIIEQTGSSVYKKEYRYLGSQTCCTDGTCALACPLGINTGEVTDIVREQTNPVLFNKALTLSARHYGGFEKTVCAALTAAVATEKVITAEPLIVASDFMHRLYSQVPHWSKQFPMPARLHFNEVQNPDYIYFPACVTRIFGASSLGKDDLITVVLRVAGRAGMKVSVPRAVHGLCCSQIWEHKGDREGERIAANRIVEGFYDMSQGGRIPIFCDTTSCTHSLMTAGAKEGILSPENRSKFDALHIMDITEWLLRDILPKLKITAPRHNVVLHPTCASKLLKVNTLMIEIAKKCALKVTVPDDARCCGSAGDRGFLFPEVPRTGTVDEKANIDRLADGSALPDGRPQTFDGFYSLARTCEMILTENIGRPYESIIYLVDETTA